MQPPTVSLPSSIEHQVLSYWRLGPAVTGGRWYDIYRAAPRSTSPSTGFGYVLKLVNPELTKQKRSRAIDRLGREALATERIAHPNVIRLFDAELDKAPFFLVQPWMDGRSFDRIISKSIQMSLSRMLWVFRQVAEGVRAGHEKGRVHLGIDPAHIIVGKTGRATLLGWSQSHAIGEKTWLPHDRLQPARYRAPESFEPEYVAQKSSDVYSLGVLIWHALAMKSPFQGETIEDIKKAHRHQISEDLMFVQPNCPAVLSSLVKMMLSKNPQLRPSFSEVLNRLISIEIEHLNDSSMIRL